MTMEFNHYADVAEALLRIRKPALFSDMDGTLVDFNDVPENVRMPATTVKDIKLLHETLGGAFAVVTGRDMAFIDHTIFPDFEVPLSVGHGTQLRLPNKPVVNVAISVDEKELDALLQDYQKRFILTGVRIESKPHARALHWVESPLPHDEVEKDIRPIIDEIIARYNADKEQQFHVKAEIGRKVFEIGPAAASKGHALTMFMQDERFQGRTPIFLGDQPADASAMQVARDMGGIAIGVGKDAPSIAHYRLNQPEDARSLIKTLAAGNTWNLEP